MSTIVDAALNFIKHYQDVSLDIPLIMVNWTNKRTYFTETTHPGRLPTRHLIQLKGQLVAIIGNQRLIIGRTNGDVATSDTHVFLSVKGTVFSEAEVEVHVRVPFEALQPKENLKLQIRRYFSTSIAQDQPYPHTPAHAAHDDALTYGSMLPMPVIRDQFLLYRGARRTEYEILTYVRFHVLQLYRRPPSKHLRPTRAGSPVLTLDAPITDESTISVRVNNPAATTPPSKRKTVHFVPHNSMWDRALIEDGDEYEARDWY